MYHHFEIFFTTDQITHQQWRDFYCRLLKILGPWARFGLAVRFDNSIVRLFISSTKDISYLSHDLAFLVIRPATANDFKLPTTKRRLKLRLNKDKSIFDNKERIEITKSESLEMANFDVVPINTERALVKMSAYFKNQANQWSCAPQLLIGFPTRLLEIDFAHNARYLKRSLPRYLDIEKSVSMLLPEKDQAIFKVDGWPYFQHEHYLHLKSYDFDKHSMIIGSTGTGKSQLIALLIERLYHSAINNNYRVIIIDPHASLAAELTSVTEQKIINFNQEGAKLFADQATDIAAATELTAALFKSLLADQFNARLDRLLRFSLYVLLTAQTMSLNNLKRLLLDIELRNKIITHVKDYIPRNISQYFATDFNEIKTKYYNDTVLPIISLIDELQLQPALEGQGDISLARTIQEKYLTVFSLNKVSMGEKTVKTIAGLLIQQIFLLAQAKVFSQKIILVIDEVSIVQNPAIAAILAEARKFNLSIILSQQYFGQISRELREAIFANTYNYYIFRVSEEDARLLEGNLNIVLPKKILAEEKEKGLQEADIRVKILTDLNPRECLVRLTSGDIIYPCLKVRTVDTSAGLVPTDNVESNTANCDRQGPEKFIE